MVLSDVTVEFNFHGAGSYSKAARKQELFIIELFIIGRKLFAAKASGD
jgi:hypothetical protein